MRGAIVTIDAMGCQKATAEKIIDKGGIRHAALNMIRQTQKKRVSIKRMRKAAGWDDSVLTGILAQVF